MSSARSRSTFVTEVFSRTAEVPIVSFLTTHVCYGGTNILVWRRKEKEEEIGSQEYSIVYLGIAKSRTGIHMMLSAAYFARVPYCSIIISFCKYDSSSNLMSPG